MNTKHIIYYNNSQNMKNIENNSINFILTSPPYPMIEMWDEIFFKMNDKIKVEFKKCNYYNSFLLMHNELNKVWKECVRVLKPGGVIAINIGDATRTLNNNFQLFTNHSYIINYMQQLGMQSLPMIIWRKTSNKPNKFMGSGMLPVNAYVTLEHEYILLFRKNGKRKFNKEETTRRKESAFFWEERNIWFSDIWTDIVGENQKIEKLFNTNRDRSAAFPLELALRLINMFSIYEDTILDPFIGTGTTSIASAILGRNSIGYEIDNSFENLIIKRFGEQLKETSINYFKNRLEKHKKFIDYYKQKNNKDPKHFNENLKLSVITSQETQIQFYNLSLIERKGQEIVCSYNKFISPFLKSLSA